MAMESGEPADWHVAAADHDDAPELEDPWDTPDDRDPWGIPGERPRRSRLLAGSPGRLTAVVAIAAAAAGVAIGLAFVRSAASHASAASSPAASPSPAGPASAAGPAGSGSNGGLPGLAPLSGNGSGTLQLSVVGTVQAVSSHSITLGGNGPSVTAAITGATKFTGSVTRVSGIKVGSEAVATVTGTGSSLTVAAIQDPAAT
jgi:hypothetical protein